MVGSRAVLFGVAVSLIAVSAAFIPSIASAGPANPPPAAGNAALQPGLIPAYAHPNGTVTERQLAVLAGRLQQQLGSQTARPIAVLHPFAPVNRLRVLVALVKLGLVGDEPVSVHTASQKLPPDAASIPAWGTPYVAVAVEQGWWPGDRPLQAREAATWTFVKTVLISVMSSSGAGAGTAGSPSAASAGAAAPDQPAAESYTGLVLDARGMDLQRTMGPRILDEDGQVLYPDPKHVPEIDFLQDHGMAAYVKDGAETPRSGKRPLTVPVVGITGAGRVDLVISRETARQIREAEARDGFLAHWAVSILISAS